MSALHDLEARLQNDVSQGVNWARELLDSHLPVIHDAAERLSRLESSPLLQAMESAVLPPQVEQAIIAILAAVAERTAPAAPPPAPESLQAA